MTQNVLMLFTRTALLIGCAPLGSAYHAAPTAPSPQDGLVVDLPDGQLPPQVVELADAYYANVDTSSPAQLRRTLHETICGHVRYQYTSSNPNVTDTWDILHEADQDLDHSSPPRVAIRDLYANAIYRVQRGDNGFYNREHVWPKGYGFPDNRRGNVPYTDCHHLFLCNIALNNARGNLLFGPANGTEHPIEFADDLPAGRDRSNWRDVAAGLWSPWLGRRGDVARALFYMDVRYEGGPTTCAMYGEDTPIRGSEPDLILTNDAALVASTLGRSNPSVAYMGLLDTLIEWHYQDPVDDRERQHNAVVATFQKNRNPFVDHPEFVSLLFRSTAEATALRYPLRNDLSERMFISEVHHANEGDDRSEFVELIGCTDDSVDSMMIVGYNVSTGRAYRSMELAGSFPAQGGGMGALAFDFDGFQDERGDAVALIAANGQVLEFISFGGVIQRALDGPAAGYASTDVGVLEDETSHTDQSLQRLKAGWAGPIPSTPGELNEPAPKPQHQDEEVR